jgi:hypothetical protein
MEIVYATQENATKMGRWVARFPLAPEVESIFLQQIVLIVNAVLLHVARRRS